VAKADMVHSVSGWTRGVQVKLWDPLRTRAVPERLRGVFTTRRYTNPRLPYVILPAAHTQTIPAFAHQPQLCSLCASISCRVRTDPGKVRKVLENNEKLSRPW